MLFLKDPLLESLLEKKILFMYPFKIMNCTKVSYLTKAVSRFMATENIAHPIPFQTVP